MSKLNTNNKMQVLKIDLGGLKNRPVAIYPKKPTSLLPILVATFTEYAFYTVYIYTILPMFINAVVSVRCICLCCASAP